MDYEIVEGTSKNTPGHFEPEHSKEFRGYLLTLIANQKRILNLVTQEEQAVQQLLTEIAQVATDQSTAAQTIISDLTALAGNSGADPVVLTGIQNAIASLQTLDSNIQGVATQANTFVQTPSGSNSAKKNPPPSHGGSAAHR